MHGRMAVAGAAIAMLIAVPACTRTVDGAAERIRFDAAGGDGPGAGLGYDVDGDRCGLLADSTIADLLAAEHVTKAYHGPVCQYVLIRADAPLDVTYSWFASGSLQRERRLAEERGAEIRDTTLHRHPGFFARRDVTGTACAATAGLGTDDSGRGVLSWWVQHRGRSDGDPCADAERLLAATLSAAM
ncbi:DUF3558 family protein [Mycolicibacterium thermoresistibile]|jgi:hypothetical protein|uniref:DUF3558 domain-containing protein n=2 Tax=Mycolicibacterium thermoresistibile TaxID=1797 RepID=G7CKV5_MYCT3|nr:DUF3558 family protein [Mycolicibacterium thermoresistibile]EHI11762.1 hypothetical protein KEK_12723 [Mycolicibacterium thermoresistibile ATCC 19527]MCV7187812.1 DUF3558 domain-containing protein [Mycolicibacterium thermoresistibile]GAT15950.1 putative uncharacterized protein [Mycolicibacterium thermoresistibile]SNW17084.1 Protein of uncharacterised function (DUF3558) [Mycolicibacterium thermoresistibile]